MKESDVARILHSRGVAVVFALLLAGAARFAFDYTAISYIPSDRGFVLPSPNLWISNGDISFWVNVSLTIFAAFGMLLLSRTFNLLRTVSQLDSSLFLVMSLSAPDLLCQFFSGTLLVIVLLCCLFLLYSTYASPQATPRIFLLFFILSGAAMTQYCYAVYIPVFVIGVGQMRIFSLRTVSAMLAGIVTPWWIAIGGGLVDMSEIHLPELTSFFAMPDTGGMVNIMLAVVLTAILLLGGWSLNFMKMLSYNAHLRAYTGTLSVMSIFTLLAMVADFNNVYAYLPVLYMLCSFQLCQTFVNRDRSHSAGAIASILILYLGLYALAVLV